MKMLRIRCLSKVPTLLLMCGLFVVALLGSPASASSIRHLQIDDMLQASELVFEGRVVASESRWNAGGTQIHTYITFELSDVIVGDYAQQTLQLRFVGGTVGDDTVAVDGLVYPTIDEQGIYFVETLRENLINPLLGWSQGHFLIKKNKGGEETVMTQDKAAVISLEPSNSGDTQLRLSDGVAGGLKVKRNGSAKDLQYGMSKQNFKRQLKQQLKQKRKQRTAKPAVTR